MYHLIRKLLVAAVLSVVLMTGASLSSAMAQTGPIPPGSPLLLTMPEADTVHLILTGYTAVNGSDIGPDCQSDLIALQSMFRKTFQGGLRNRLKIHCFYGDDWTVAKIRQRIEELKIGANDVIVFYHAGHGAIMDGNQPVETHSLQVGHGQSMKRGDILRLLMARQGRGVVAMTDCCSSFPKVLGGMARGAEVQGPLKLNVETVRNLFLKFRGLVDITAAEVGTGALNGNHLDDFAGARGAFTTAFLKLASDERTFANWADFFPQLRDLTRTSSGGMNQAEAFTLREEAPVHQTGPIGPGAPKTQVGPGGPGGSTGPTGPVAPGAPKTPAGPGGPTGPVGPAAPKTPPGPVGPGNPTGPVGPGSPVNPVAPKTPASFNVVGTQWNGNEALQGFGKLTFVFQDGQNALMIDAQSQVKGTYTINGGTVRLDFGNAIYTGTIQGNVMSGTAHYVTQNGPSASWSWTVQLQGQIGG